MALIEYRLDGTVNKVENAIKRIQLANLSEEPPKAFLVRKKREKQRYLAEREWKSYTIWTMMKTAE